MEEACLSQFLVTREVSNEGQFAITMTLPIADGGVCILMSFTFTARSAARGPTKRLVAFGFQQDESAKASRNDLY